MMFALRSTRQAAFVRQLVSPSSTPTFAIAGRRFAHGDYGSGAVKPGTPNNAVDKEHPGPPPPSAAQGKGEQQQDKKQADTNSNDSSSSKSTSGAQPKILSDNPPAEGQESEDVAKHNEDMQQRADRPTEGVQNEDAQKDKVPKGYWSGTGGRDAEP